MAASMISSSALAVAPQGLPPLGRRASSFAVVCSKKKIKTDKPYGACHLACCRGLCVDHCQLASCFSSRRWWPGVVLS